MGVTHLVGFAGTHPLAFVRLSSALVMWFLSMAASASNKGRVLTWFGFDLLLFTRQHRVTWQAGPIRCGSQ